MMKRWLYFFAVFVLHLTQESCFAEDWKRVYLATYPRAGNHWMRHLIEEATHVATSSVYVDSDGDDVKHLETPFPWGGYAAPKGCIGSCAYPKEGEIVVIKTHYPSFSRVLYDLQPSNKTIRIIRHPVDSFWSFYIKRYPDADRIPLDFLLRLINAWRTFQEYWDKQDHVMTIRYEDLYKDTFSSLKKVLFTIGYKIEDKDIHRAIEKHPPKGGMYKYVSTFNKEDLKLVEEALEDLLKKYHYSTG